MLSFPAKDGEQGLWGFNGVLVGCAFPTFMGNTVWMWLALALCSALRHRGDGHAQQGAPAHKSLSLGIGAPENADHKQKSRPRAVLKHHLPGTAQQNFDKIERASAGPSGSSDRICHTYNYLTVNKVSIATETLRAAACP